MSIIQEFKKFAVKGNVIDMAIGVVIGGAFGKIVTSFVNDIIMPPISALTGGIDFSNLNIILRQASNKSEAVVLNYGIFINTVLNFLIIAISIFIVIKQMNKLKKKEEDKPKQTGEDILLLREIRDSLKNNKKLSRE